MLRCSCSHIAGSHRITSVRASPPPFVRALVKPFLGSSSLSQTSSRAVLPHSHFGTSCKAMGKVDDPSQAFHGGQAKARSALDEMSGTGEFKRTDSTYRDHIKKGTRFEPEGIHGQIVCLSLQSLLHSPDFSRMSAWACTYQTCVTLQLEGTTFISPMHVHGQADA
jgi:hypothetical protein